MDGLAPHNAPMQLGDRRGPMILMHMEWPGGRQHWEPWADVLGRSRYFRFRGSAPGAVTLDQLERVLAMSEPEEIEWRWRSVFIALPGYDDEMDD